jgi:uncharacterized protein YfaP (DUF2135 family)
MAVKTYSRLARVEEAKARKTVLVYAFLTLAVILFLLFFGVRILTSISSFIQPEQKQTTTDTDRTPPSPPQLDYVQPRTNVETQTIKGEAEPDAVVQISVNGSVTSTRSDSGGGFSLDVVLSEGDNTITAKATDTAGNMSNQSEVISINLDKTPPTLTVTKPTAGQSFKSKDSPIRVEGQTDAERVTINDRIAVIDSQGKFSLPFNLSEGQNDLLVVAVDQAGNKTEMTISVSYTP